MATQDWNDPAFKTRRIATMESVSRFAKTGAAQGCGVLRRDDVEHFHAAPVVGWPL